MDAQKRKYFWIVFNAAFVLFMVKVDAFIVFVSLPTIARSFGLNAAEVSRVVVAYLLLLTNTMLIFGKLEDRLGVRRLFIYGYSIFLAGSLLCGLSPNLPALVSARAIQGVGGAMMLICGFGVVNKFLPPEIKGWGLGIVMTAAALGLATGAPLGGYVTHFLSWRWIFFINIPLGVLGIFAVVRTLPRAEPVPAESPRFDYPGAALSFAGLTGITYVLSCGPQAAGSLSTPVILLFSLIVLVVFVIWERRCPDPLLDMRIFRNAGFTCGNIALFFICMILSGVDFIVPFYLELARGLMPYQVGFFMLLYSAAYPVFAPLAGRLADRPGLGAVISISTTLPAAGLFFAYGLALGLPGPAATIVFFVLWGIATAFFLPENFRLIFAGTPEDRKGVGAGILNIFNNLGMIFGVCVFQIIFSHLTHSGDIPDPSALGNAGWSKDLLFATFRNIFIFGGVLYLLAALFSSLAERRPVERN